MGNNQPGGIPNEKEGKMKRSQSVGKLHPVIKETVITNWIEYEI